MVTKQSGLESPNNYDPSKSSTYEKVNDLVLKDEHYLANDIKDDIVFNFQDATSTVFRTELLGITGVKADELKYLSNKSDGTLGLAPFDHINRHTNFLY